MDLFSKTLYLIDGSSYIYRAYHAVRNLSTSKGFPTNAIFGFTRMILKLLDDRKPTYAAMIFDAKGPTFRHELFPNYKGNRPPMPEDLVLQLDYIKTITRGFNLPMFEMQGYEADDIIGSFAKQAESNQFDVIIVSGDKDMMQLVTQKIKIWDPMKDSETTLQTIQEKIGLTPNQLIDMMGLWGDTSDNIPGVPGIGQKTAAALIQEFNSMDNLYEQIESITRKKQKENLIQFKDQAYMSRQLVTINTEVPLQFVPDQFKLTGVDAQKLGELFAELEFRQLRERFPIEIEQPDKKYYTLTTIKELNVLLKKLNQVKRFAIDTETTSVNPMLAELVGISFSFQPHEAYYVPCAHKAPKNSVQQIERHFLIQLIKPILESPDNQIIGQNIKYDWIVLKRYGITLANVTCDTMIASYVLNPSDQMHGLDRIAMDLFNYKMTSYKELTKIGTKSISFDKVPIEKAGPYACEDADITFMASHSFLEKLNQLNLQTLFQTIEMPLIPVLVDMERHGILVDAAYLKQLSHRFDYQLSQLEEKIYQIAGETFNINSTQQLGTILFEKLNLPVQKKTKKKTGYSTDVNVLTSLAEIHELPSVILRYRTLAKLKSTYVDALIELIHPETQRIHTSFNQSITATGRLSSSNPNLQNIPIRTDESREIRRAFIPDKDAFLFSADYSQIELRILAHYANDPILIDAFQKDEDIHARTASELFNLFPTMITPEMRRQAKAINFGIIYGMGAFRLAKEIHISQKMAKNYIEQYFIRYAGVKKFIDETIEEVRQKGHATTLFGRIRPIPDIHSKNKNIKAMAERIAVNTLIQGTAADLIKLAMIRVHDVLQKENLRSRMILSVHDEIVLEVYHTELERVKGLIQTLMESVWSLRVPLKVNIGIGKNWSDTH